MKETILMIYRDFSSLFLSKKKESKFLRISDFFFLIPSLTQLVGSQTMPEYYYISVFDELLDEHNDSGNYYFRRVTPVCFRDVNNNTVAHPIYSGMMRNLYIHCK